jgi:RNA polymerase primary sigma factor
MGNTTARKRNPNNHRLRATPALLARVRDWVEREIKYVDHAEYAEAGAVRQLAMSRPQSLDDITVALSEPTIAFVSGLVDTPLLTPDEEVYLFKWMNFLRYRAEQRRQRLSLNSPDESLVDQIEADCAESIAVRNRIISSNLRLVVGLARKLSTSLDQMSDLIAEATVPLIRSVELFDIGLGNRFSTYATWAVRNHMLRCLQRRQSTTERNVSHDQSILEQMPDERTDPDEQLRTAEQRVQAVHCLLDSLNERERLVITARFGLDGQPRGQSLQDIASQIGLSKERVRQIAMSAIGKLQGLAKSADIAS